MFFFQSEGVNFLSKEVTTIAMTTKAFILCCLLVFGTSMAEELEMESFDNADSLADFTSEGIAGRNDGFQMSYRYKPHLILGRFDSKIQRQEQGNAGLWGKRQEPAQWNNRYEYEERQKKGRAGNMWKQRTSEGKRKRQQYGSAGLWGKRQLPERRFDALHNLWHRREVGGPPKTGLWGKRSKDSRLRLEREELKVKRQQPSKIGLWKGKRGTRINNSKRPSGAEKTGLWGKKETGTRDVWEQIDRVNSKKTDHLL